MAMDDEEDEKGQKTTTSGRLTVSSSSSQFVRQSSMTTSSVRSVTSSSFTSFDESVLSEDGSTKTSPIPGPFPRLRKTGSDSDETASYLLKADHASSSAASRSMESLRQEHQHQHHRSFLERGETRRLGSSEMRHRSQESSLSFEEKQHVTVVRSASAVGRTPPPSHLSLAPPSFERKLTILSPGWGPDKKLKRPQMASLPRLILPTPDQQAWSRYCRQFSTGMSKVCDI
ncbi:Hypothetical protein NTJ_13086 [Nesidiocoris tenuis]|uniref:Uncharacterized protein n=1 Tax=Nesidiocoris tenuis TaxID=355587 RepID=A0ABN7B7A1_9HEMI|nr:Hypothetical protein NTJ_13086 [Nesidiocoris tenuis]